MKAIVDGVRGAMLRLQSGPVVGNIHIRNRHGDLLDRDAPDQHPISAIVGLDKKLSERVSHTELSGRDEPDQHPIGSVTRLPEELTARPPSGYETDFDSDTTPKDNTLYDIRVSGDPLTINAANAGERCGVHFIIDFAANTAVELNCISSTGDDIAQAVAGDVWEISILRGRAVVKKM